MENIRLRIEYKIGGAFPVNDSRGYNNSCDSLRIKLIKNIEENICVLEINDLRGYVDIAIYSDIAEPIFQNINNGNLK